jgi:hypothetical protein
VWRSPTGLLPILRIAKLSKLGEDVTQTLIQLRSDWSSLAASQPAADAECTSRLQSADCEDFRERLTMPYIL